MADSLRDLGISLVICFISMPVAIVITIFLYPLWSWIESIGHSGPDEWCYLATCFIILSFFIFIRWSARRGRTTWCPGRDVETGPQALSGRFHYGLRLAKRSG